MSAPTVATGLSLMAAHAAGAMFASRPRGVHHVVVEGSVTPSGRWVSRGGRAVCGRRMRRRHEIVQGPPPALDLGGRRFCRSCTAVLPPALGYDGPLVSRDDYAAAYAGLSLGHLALAARWCRTVEETHQVGRVALIVHGPDPVRRPTTPGPAYDRWALEQVILGRRNELRIAERPAEDREAAARARDAEADEIARIAAARRQGDRIDRAVDRRNRGKYLAPWERELLATGT